MYRGPSEWSTYVCNNTKNLETMTLQMLGVITSLGDRGRGFEFHSLPYTMAGVAQAVEQPAKNSYQP